MGFGRKEGSGKGKEGLGRSELVWEVPELGSSDAPSGTCLYYSNPFWDEDGFGAFPANQGPRAQGPEMGRIPGSGPGTGLGLIDLEADQCLLSLASCP